MVVVAVAWQSNRVGLGIVTVSFENEFVPEKASPLGEYIGGDACGNSPNWWGSCCLPEGRGLSLKTRCHANHYAWNARRE